MVSRCHDFRGIVLDNDIIMADLMNFENFANGLL